MEGGRKERKDVVEIGQLSVFQAARVSGRLTQLNDIKERDYLMSPHEHLSASDKDISSN